VTRAADQAADLVSRLEREGAIPVLAPMIRIAPPIDAGSLDDVSRHLQRYDWIVFSSVNAAEALIESVKRTTGSLQIFTGIRLCAVGSATADRLTRYGLHVAVVPGEFRAERIAETLSSVSELKNASVLIPRSDIGRDVAAATLSARGAHVTDVVAYRTLAVEPTRDGGPDVRRLLSERAVEVVTFTSPSAVDNLVRVVGNERASSLLAGMVVACIGPVTSETALRHGIRTDVVPREYTVTALVAALAEHVARSARRS